MSAVMDEPLTTARRLRLNRFGYGENDQRQKDAGNADDEEHGLPRAELADDRQGDEFKASHEIDDEAAEQIGRA